MDNNTCELLKFVRKHGDQSHIVSQLILEPKKSKRAFIILRNVPPWRKTWKQFMQEFVKGDGNEGRI